MPNPSCTVKNGSAAPQTTPPVAIVAPYATVTISLADATGVDVWSLSCVATDEASSVSATNAGLVVNAATKTATFTAPDAGSSLIFYSVVNNGVDRYGRPDASLGTTFKIATPTADGYVVLATGETYEHDATSGYTGVINQIIRGGSGSGGGASLPAFANAAGAALVEKTGGGTVGGVEFRRLGVGDIDVAGNNTVLGTDGSGKAVARKVKATDVDTTGDSNGEVLTANGSGAATFRKLTAADIDGLGLSTFLSPSGTLGAVIVEDPANSFKVRKLRQSDIAPDFAIASFAKTAPDSSTLLYARGATIAAPTFTATYANGAPEAANITISSSGSSDAGDVSLGALTFASPFTSASYAGTLKKNGTDAGADPVVTFTLSATDNDSGITATATRAITFTSHVYWGVTAASAITATNVFDSSLQAGFSESLQTTRTQTRSVTASNQYVYLLWPNAAPYVTGTATFTDTMTGFSFDVAAQSTVQLTRNGVTRTYAVWRSTESLTGTFSVKVE